MTLEKTAAEMLCRFDIWGKLEKLERYGCGHINDTFLVITDRVKREGKYILQRLSAAAFKDPEKVMENVTGVTSYLHHRILENGGDPDRETLTLIPLKDDPAKYHVIDEEGCCWRVYLLIDHAVTYQLPENERIFTEAGKSFGRFQKMLSNYPAETLHETIPHFHDTPARIEAFRKAVAEDAAKRANGVEELIRFVEERAVRASALMDQLRAGKLPVRVTHNDTKLNNVLLQEGTDEALCVVDLDTVMPGLSSFDFGDAIRFGANTAAEDEKDLGKVHFSVPMFRAWSEGYLSETGSMMTAAEIDSLALGSWMMTYECGVRFLADYLNGDIYFHTAYPEHNLVRAKNQFALLADMEAHEQEMLSIVRGIADPAAEKNGDTTEMNEPILLIMAAGMGSRYGGLKQMDPVGPAGEVILHYSIFDARRAGFKRVIFLIKHEIEEDFKRIVGEPVSKYMEVRYAFQQTDNIPAPYTVPAGRTKPWGTGHAVLCCRDLIDAPFAVINADDYYGVSAFQTAYDSLICMHDDDIYRYMMVGYQLNNTTTDNGHVARGVCEVDPEGRLLDITERTHIVTSCDGALFTEDGKHYELLSGDTLVSMNMWGFTPSILKELGEQFPAFLEKACAENPLKAEYFLPTVVDGLLKAGRATVDVLRSKDRWYGVTYREDRPVVVAALKKMTEDGLYPSPLWK